MKELQKHLDAFELYFKSKQDGANTEESIKLLMSDFKVSRKTAYKWKKEFDWDGREAIRSQEIQKRIEEKTNTTIVDNKVKYLSFYHKLLDDLKNDFKLKIKDVNDLKRVIDGALLLQDQPTEKTENTYSGLDALADSIKNSIKDIREDK
jgi:hypothetical protein